MTPAEVVAFNTGGGATLADAFAEAGVALLLPEPTNLPFFLSRPRAMTLTMARRELPDGRSSALKCFDLLYPVRGAAFV